VTVMPTEQIAQLDFDAARAVLQRHGRTFSFASRLLGNTHAERAAVLYAFCRHVDDVADGADTPGAALAALVAIRDSLVTGRAGDVWTRAMLTLQADTRMPSAPAMDLIDGVSSDLMTVRMADEAALVRYAYQVAGTVGLMMCAVLDVHDPRARPFAIDLGIAMQLTNIARDVGEDARMGRRYLPASWIGDVAPADIAAPDPDLQRTLQDATRRLLVLADRYYASGESGLAFLPARARLAILAAARMYRAIGGRIAAADHCSWDRRAVVGTVAKSGHALRAMLAFAFSPRLHQRQAVHDVSLHLALASPDQADG
jgi:15-cis-phytoene synthase